MNEELKLILDSINSDPEKAIAEIRKKTKSVDDIEKYTKEYKEFERNQRESQVDSIQLDKSRADGKTSKMVKIYINHAQNIVETLAAFVIGKPVNLVPSVDNNLSILLRNLWRVNRIDSKILQSTMIRMSETQVAMNFYIKDIEPTSLINKVLVNIGLKTQAKEIKAKVLNNKTGVMTPYFDATGDMILFMWQYEVKVGTATVKKIQIWTDTNIIYIDNATGGKFAITQNIPHGFDRIPIVYDSQDEPQWYPVRTPIDRHEVAMSKLGDSNDYSGHPILVTEGEVKSMPLKEESGKHFNIPIEVDEDGNETRGKVSFLEAKTAPESNKLEIDKLEDIIAYGSGVANLSLERLKSLGNVAEKTVKLMFLGTEIKAELQRDKTRTFIERCLNIMLSGITKTTNIALSKEGELLYYDIHFNSILPSDIGERVKMVSEAVSSGLMSKQTGVTIIDLTEDAKSELEQIKAEKTEDTDPNKTEETTEE